MEMYVIVWKYKINPSDRPKFEAEYGPGGSWVSFFRGSLGYVGSKLYLGKDHSYLLIDAWVSKDAYKRFRDAKQNRYQQLSDQFSYLFEEEICIGDFHELKGVLTSIL